MMDDKSLAVMAFTIQDEKKQWKFAKFAHNNVIAIRSCGRAVSFEHEDDASEFVTARAMERGLAFYHTEMAKVK